MQYATTHGFKAAMTINSTLLGKFFSFDKPHV